MNGLVYVSALFSVSFTYSVCYVPTRLLCYDNYAQFPIRVVVMSCPEIGHAFSAMSQDMRMKLGGYAVSLQARYGDPRVYAQQQEQMARDQAAVEHAKSKKTARLLEDAYARQTERNRVTHHERLSSRADRRSTSHPESAAKPQRARRKTVQIEQPAAPSPQPDPSPAATSRR